MKDFACVHRGIEVFKDTASVVAAESGKFSLTEYSCHVNGKDLVSRDLDVLKLEIDAELDAESQAT